MPAGAMPYWAFMPEDGYLQLQGMLIQEKALDAIEAGGIMNAAVHIGGIIALVLVAFYAVLGGNWQKQLERIVMLALLWFAIKLPRVSVGGAEVMVRGDEAVTSVEAAQVSRPFFWMMNASNAVMGGFATMFARAGKDAVVKHAMASTNVLLAREAAHLDDEQLEANVIMFVRKCMTPENLARLNAVKMPERVGNVGAVAGEYYGLSGWESAFKSGSMDYAIRGAGGSIAGSRWETCQKSLGQLNEDAKMAATKLKERSMLGRFMGFFGKDEKWVESENGENYLLSVMFEKAAARSVESRTEEFKELTPETGGVVPWVAGGYRSFKLWLSNENTFGTLMGVVTLMIYALWPLVPFTAAILGSWTPLITYGMLIVWVRSWPMFYILVRMVDDSARDKIGEAMKAGAGAPPVIAGMLRAIGAVQPDPAASISEDIAMVTAALVPMIPVFAYFFWFRGVGPMIGVQGISVKAPVQAAGMAARAAA